MLNPVNLYPVKNACKMMITLCYITTNPIPFYDYPIFKSRDCVMIPLCIPCKSHCTVDGSSRTHSRGTSMLRFTRPPGVKGTSTRPRPRSSSASS